ncbi:MAG: histidinol-phosphate transaminase [Gemmataceae bacterium]
MGLRANIVAMTGYTPGEQPRADGYIKLNTNENPYPPSPRVLEALQRAISAERLRKYPDPYGWEVRQAAAHVLGLTPEHILIGNGSDDILTIVTRAFVPEGGVVASPWPSYLLYETLAAIQGAHLVKVPFRPDWDVDPARFPPEVHLTYLANPNSPTGTVVRRESVVRLPGFVVIDEAYADFADGNLLDLVRTSERFLVTRSLSKSYSLAGIRFGLGIGAPEVIRHLYKVKDSYNCDVLSLIAAREALLDQEHMRANCARLRATRTRLIQALRDLGWHVLDSQANFVWTQPRGPTARAVAEALRQRAILVRYMDYPGFGDGLRISIGTDEDMDRLIHALRAIVGAVPVGHGCP